MSGILARLQDKKDQLDALRPLQQHALENLEAWYDVELTYTSNALEGNTLTRSETAIVIEKGLTVRGKPLKDHEEAVDHFEALQFVRSLVNDPRPVTEMDIKSIHRLVVARIQNGEAGQYSKYERMISGSSVKLPSPEKIAPLMADFGEWIMQADATPENAIDAHIQLVTIHPFSDGNGRTARLLMNLMLMRGGYPPMVIPPEDRPDYIDGLEQAQLTGSKTEYQTFMLRKLETSLDDYLNFLRGD